MQPKPLRHPASSSSVSVDAITIDQRPSPEKQVHLLRCGSEATEVGCFLFVCFFSHLEIVYLYSKASGHLTQSSICSVSIRHKLQCNYMDSGCVHDIYVCEEMCLSNNAHLGKYYMMQQSKLLFRMPINPH